MENVRVYWMGLVKVKDLDDEIIMSNISGGSVNIKPNDEKDYSYLERDIPNALILIKRDVYRGIMGQVPTPVDVEIFLERNNQKLMIQKIYGVTEANAKELLLIN